MDNSGQNQGQNWDGSNHSQQQMNQFQQMQAQQFLQNSHSNNNGNNNNSTSLNQPNQQMGGPLNNCPPQKNQNQPMNGVANVAGQQSNGGQNNQFNVMNCQPQQQSLNQPLSGLPQGSQTPNMGGGNSSTPNVFINSTMPFPGFLQGAPAVGGGGAPSGNSNSNAAALAQLGNLQSNQLQQQQQAQKALLWNALQASQGQTGTQGGQNSSTVGGGGGTNNMNMNVQLGNNMNMMAGNINPTQSQNQLQPQPAPNAFNNVGGNSDGNNLVGAQAFNQMNLLQMQIQLNSNRMQQLSQNMNGRPPSSSGLSNNPNLNNVNVQQQLGNLINPNLPMSYCNQQTNGGNFINLAPGLQQGNMVVGNNSSSSPDNAKSHQSVLYQQYVNNQIMADAGGNGSNGSNNPNGIMQNYVKQLQLLQMQQIQQQFSGQGNSNDVNNSLPNEISQGQVPVPSSMNQVESSQSGQMQQIQGNENSFAPETVSAPSSSMHSDPNLSQLLAPDSIVTGGKVHAATFPVMAIPDGVIAPDGQYDGEMVEVQVQGICVQGGNNCGSNGQRLLDGNFAGGWQSNGDLAERKRMVVSIVKIVDCMRPGAGGLSQDLMRVPQMAKKLEEHLYRSAHTREEYLDYSSLKRRLHLIAKGVGVPRQPNGQNEVFPFLADQLSMQPHNSQSSNDVQLDSFMQPVASSQGQGSMGLNPQQINSQALQMQQQQSQQNTMSQPPTNVQPAQAGTRSEKKQQVLAQQQRRLTLLRHSKLCKTQGCTTRFCPQMVILWKHLKSCRNKACKVPHCLSSRCVLSHQRNCKRKGLSDICEICLPVKQLALKLGDVEGDDWNDDWDNFSVFEPDADGNSLVSSGGATSSTSKSNGSAIVSEQTMPQPQAQSNLPSSSQEIRDDIEKKQAVLEQIRSQKGTLVGQNTMLLTQLSMSQSQEISTQIQNQISLLRQLSSQFDTQEAILQDQISRQKQALEQIDRNSSLTTEVQSNSIKEKPPKQRKPRAKATKPSKRKESSSDSTPPLPPLPPLPSSDMSLSAPTSASRKRSVSQKGKGKKDEEESQLRKSLRPDDSTPVLSSESAGLVASITTNQDGILSTNESKEPTQDDSTADVTGTGILSAMSVEAIEKHLKSLVSGQKLTPRCISRKCLPLVKKLSKHDNAWPFNQPVDPVKLQLENYFEVVENPMDLGSVEEKLNNLVYSDIDSVERDVTLVFDNAILFNGEDNDIGRWARELLDIFVVDIKTLRRGLGMVSKEDGKEACRNDATCSLCGHFRLLYDPPGIYCMQKIRRNVFYYTDQRKQNSWCDRCYAGLSEDKTIQLDDGKETKKSLLIRLKNDSTPEEQWVACDDCENWCHQTCALFNPSRKNSSKAFSCPKCVMKCKDDAPVSSFKDATALPECKLSRAIEEGLSQTLSEEYDKIAKERKCDVSQVEKAEGLCVRVVMSQEKKHKVREGMLSRYSHKGFPSEFPVTSKCILLFQKIHGVDVLLFGMYVYEYGDKCPLPNRRRVYISYLDSVHYLQPSLYRTLTYHTIIIEYLRFVRLRGFHTAHIWSCPPSKGDEYIFYCHPRQQLIPKDDMLRAWYVEMLKKAQDTGVVLETRTIYDEYFKDNGVNPETGDLYDPTSIPYFEGDYIPGEIEKIISIINKDESQCESSKHDTHSKSNSAKGHKIEGKRRGTRSNPGELVNQDRDKLMNRLDPALCRMKQNFFVAQLLSDDFIKAVETGADVSSWVEDVVSCQLRTASKQIGKNPDLLDMQPEGVSQCISKIQFASQSQTIGNTIDEDPFIEQECLDTRIAFLNFCQKKYLQFDELRRAKYSTMLLLSELHDPRAEKEHQFSVHMQVIAHAASCSGCVSKNCQLMKQLFSHVRKCETTYRNGCKVCCRLFMLLTKHARSCDADVGTCEIPFCERIRERQRRLLKQQQLLDDRRRDEQNDRHQEDKEAGYCEV